MKHFTRFCTVLAASAALLTALSGHAFAQGGGNSIPTGTLFAFDNIGSFGGATPVLSGDYTIINPIPGYYTWTTFKANWKSKSFNVPDGTVVTATLYTKDSATGVAQTPVVLGTASVLNKTALFKNASYAFFDISIINGGTVTTHVMDKVIVTLPSGQIVGIGH